MKYFVKNFLFRLTHPRFWIMEYSYSKEWDSFIIESIANDKIEITGFYSLQSYGVGISIINYPFSFGVNEALKCRPSSSTVQLLREYLATKSKEIGKKTCLAY